MNIPRVIGLDLSLTATGIADFTHLPGQVVTKTIRSSRADGDGVHGPHARLTAIRRDVFEYVAFMGKHPALVVIEGPSYGSKGAGTWDRAGLWWLIVNDLIENRHPVAVIPPAVLKKYATGRGNADKTAMAVSLAKRWGGPELGDDNKVDAFWLGAAGRDQLGLPFLEMPKTHREVLAKVAWPDVP